MSKPLREILQEANYHCFSRCQGLNKLLLKKHAESSFIEAVKMCQNYYKFKLIAVEVRDNHFHLLIRTLKDEGTVDRIMQYIKARTAEKYNRAAKRKGPFWNERYKSTIIEKSENPKRYLSRLLYSK